MNFIKNLKSLHKFLLLLFFIIAAFVVGISVMDNSLFAAKAREVVFSKKVLVVSGYVIIAILIAFIQSSKLWHKVTLGLLSGIVLGLVFGEAAYSLQVIGAIFISLIKMIIIPLIYVSIVVGMTSVNDSSALSRIAVKSIVAFLLTTSFAIVIGLTMAHIIQPGKYVDALSSIVIERSSQNTNFNLMQMVQDMVPDNALNALVSGKMIQVVFFSFFTGIVINNLGKDKKAINMGFKLAAKVVFKMVHVILDLAPYGAFALTAAVVGKQGLMVLSSLGMLVLTLVSAVIVQYLIFGIMIMIFARITPWQFYKKSFEYQALAFSTSSSKATLATTMDVCANKMGLSKNSTSFVLPLGAAINMDGMAIYLGICTLFFAQAYGITLGVFDYVVIILTSTIGSIGAAGVPSGTIIMLPMVLSAINIPIDGIALIVGIDRILDMMRTTLNITGDAAITLIVDSTEGELNKEIYYTPADKLKNAERSIF